MLKSYDLCLTLVFEVCPTMNKSISTLILDIFFYKQTKGVISRKE